MTTAEIDKLAAAVAGDDDSEPTCDGELPPFTITAKTTTRQPGDGTKLLFDPYGTVCPCGKIVIIALGEPPSCERCWVAQASKLQGAT